LLEGKLIQNLYMEPLEASSLEVFRNYKDELTSKGFNILFEAHKAETEPLAHYFGGFGPGGQSIYYNAVDGHYIAAVKEEGGVKSYVALYVVEYRDGFDGLSFSPSKDQGLVRLDVLAVGNMSSQMTAISASQITKSIETDGKVALYGLLFDFNKATLRPDSRPTLEQMAKYLTDHPAQKIYIVGHTDNVGGFEFNLDLSKARAATVAAELAQTYKVDPTRITATGVGLLAPVASNATEEGRTKNRRVELVAR
jgi:OmpA-OmpF porin, OOP family